MDVSCTTPSATNEILSSQDVELEVKKFLAGVVRHSYISPELTQTSLFLLKNVSATRNAVLEYFSTVFLVSVGKHIRLIEVSLKRDERRFPKVLMDIFLMMPLFSFI